jgi:hypothetical protein
MPQPRISGLPSHAESLRVCLITNELHCGDEPGFRDALCQLVDSHLLDAALVLAPRADAQTTSPETVQDRIVEKVAEFRPHIVIIMSPASFPWHKRSVRAIRSQCPDSLIFYWEGDAWGGAKAAKPCMRWWAECADIVFSVALGRQASFFQKCGASRVQHIPNTYCHVTFSEPLARQGIQASAIDADVAMIGNSGMRLGFLARIPGSRDRAQLVRRLQKDATLTTAIYGSGWRGRGALGQIPYGEQIARIQSARMSIGWDNFPTLPESSSDRLPIALFAGRPHITNYHLGRAWLPDASDGLFVVRSPRQAHELARELCRLQDEELVALGLRAHLWARDHVSDLQSMQFMLSFGSRRLSRPTGQPWDSLP